jgi:cell division protein FtsI (penicillin-binding protein 3)
LDSQLRFKRRFWIAVGGFAAFGLVVAVRFLILLLSPRDVLPSPPAAVERGPILDRDGRILAAAAPQFRLAAWKPDIPADRGADVSELAAILSIRSEDVERSLAESKSDFLYIKKQIGREAAELVREGKESGKFRGFMVEQRPGRAYPLGDAACHVLGYVGDDNHGLGGVEFAFDAELSPDPPEGAREVFGNQVVLTLDAGVQAILERNASEALSKNGAESIMFLAVDPRNGDILGYAAFPGFSPGDIKNADPESLLNFPANYSYEPGSVFKVFTIASMYQLGGISPSSVFMCDGAYHHEGGTSEPFTIKCMGVHGPVTPQLILSLSCNAGAAYASDNVDAVVFDVALRSLGFGSRTGAGFSGEEEGILRPVEDWSLRTKPTLAMGQEILVTALQMVQAATAVANGGILLKPRLVSRVVSPSGSVVWENPVIPVRRALDEGVARDVLEFMATGAEEGGTGIRARVKGMRVGVKTGTAQMVEKGGRAYSLKDFIASTLVILPVDEPRLILYMVIVKPRGESIHGGRIAAPVIGRTAEELINYLDIPRAGQETVIHPGKLTVGAGKPAEIGDAMPDLTGYPKRLLLPLLARTDIAVTIKGSGWVKRQSPAPGSAVRPGDSIVLELE